MPLFKFLLILSIIVYLVYKVGGFFFRAGAASQRQVKQDPYPPRAHDPKKEKKPGNVKGGEYIDYEEVK
jgi:hypothetical protein